jgi:hypothetical protein
MCRFNPCPPYGGNLDDEKTSPAHTAGAVSSVAERRIFNPRSSRVRFPDGPPERRWCSGKHDGLLNRKRQFDPGAARPCSVGVNGQLASPSSWKLRVQAPHGALRPHRPLARIRVLQIREDGSEPSGVTAGYDAGSLPGGAVRIGHPPPISRGLMAGQRTVNPSVEVRLLPREQNLHRTYGPVGESGRPRHPVNVETAGSNPAWTA